MNLITGFVKFMFTAILFDSFISIVTLYLVTSYSFIKVHHGNFSVQK